MGISSEDEEAEFGELRQVGTTARKIEGPRLGSLCNGSAEH